MSSPHNPRRVQLLICLDGLSRTEWSSGSEGPDTDLGAFDTPSGSWGCREGGLPGGSFLPKLSEPRITSPLGPMCLCTASVLPCSNEPRKAGSPERQTRGWSPRPLVRPAFPAFHSCVHAFSRSRPPTLLSPVGAREAELSQDCPGHGQP